MNRPMSLENGRNFINYHCGLIQQFNKLYVFKIPIYDFHLHLPDSKEVKKICAVVKQFHHDDVLLNPVNAYKHFLSTL